MEVVYLTEHRGQVEGTKMFRVSLDDEHVSNLGLNWVVKIDVIAEKDSHFVVGKYKRVTIEEFDEVVGVTHTLDKATELAYNRAYSEARRYALPNKVVDLTSRAKESALAGKVEG